MSAEIHTLKTGDLSEKASEDDNTRYSELIHNVFNRLNVQLLQRVSDMLNNADDVLFELSENADNAELQSKYIDLMQILRTERSNLDKSFFIAINEHIKSGSTSSETDELSLVDQEEMDEMVAVTQMYSNAMNIYGQEVNNLEARFEFLKMTMGDEVDTHSIDPRHICEAFQSAVKQIDMTLEYKLLLYKLFDMEVSSKLGDMYKSLNQLFIDAGVMPEVVYSAKNLEKGEGSDSGADDAVPEDKGFTTRTATYYDPQENRSSDFVPRSKEDIGYFISQFMNGFTTAKGEDIPESFKVMPTDKDNNNCFTRKELLSSLSKLQEEVASKKGDIEKIDSEQIKRTIVAEVGNNNGGVVTQRVNILDQRSIDFVGMMFDEIMIDNSISKVITNLLMRLQIPVVKAAMLDQEMFSHEDHPARTTLDLISEAGKGVEDEEHNVYLELEIIVDNLLKEFDVDISSFNNAVDALETLIEQEHALAEENENAEQRAIIKAHAREVVLTELRYLSSNKKLPQDVQPLVLKNWSTLMLNRYIQHGKDSNQWLQSIMLLKLLLKCLQPIKSKAQWEMLKTHHEPLVEAVNDELYETQQNKFEVDTQVSALQERFLKMIDEFGYKMVQEEEEASSENVIDAADQFTDAIPYVEEEATIAANEILDEEEQDDEAARIEEQAKIARDKIAQLPSDAHPGVWFEIFNGDDSPVRRLKLSVVLTEVAKLVFVDCRGVKVIEKDAGDFAAELENEKSRMIADHSTFEHALGTVIHKLAA